MAVPGRSITAQGPRGTSASQLDDVSCPTARGCLVVGDAYVGRRYHATAYTWTGGSTLKQIKVPGPRRARGAELAALACANANNCMAAGNYISGAGVSLPYAVKWHDGTWKILQMPGVPGVTNPWLQGDSCPAVRLCVAAGAATPAHRAPRAFFEIYRGGRWHLAATLPAGTGLLGASCPATNLCLFAGYNGGNGLVRAWNGNTWGNLGALQTTGTWPYDVFMHVSCAAANACEAIGYRYNNNREHTLAEFWDGTSWTIQATINP